MAAGSMFQLMAFYEWVKALGMYLLTLREEPPTYHNL